MAMMINHGLLDGLGMGCRVSDFQAKPLNNNQAGAGELLFRKQLKTSSANQDLPTKTAPSEIV